MSSAYLDFVYLYEWNLLITYEKIWDLSCATYDGMMWDIEILRGGVCKTLYRVSIGGEWDPTLFEREKFLLFSMIPKGSNCTIDYYFWSMGLDMTGAFFGVLHTWSYPLFCCWNYDIKKRENKKMSEWIMVFSLLGLT